MSVTMGVMDLVIASENEVVLSSPYFVPGTMGVEAFGGSAQARRQGHGAHQLARLATTSRSCTRATRAIASTSCEPASTSTSSARRRRTQNKRLMIPGASQRPAARQDRGHRPQARIHRLDESRPALGKQEHRARHHHREPGAREGGAARDPHQQAAKRLPAAARRRAARSSGLRWTTTRKSCWSRSPIRPSGSGCRTGCSRRSCRNRSYDRRLRRLRLSELPSDTATLARFLIGKTLVRDAPEGPRERPHRRMRGVCPRRRKRPCVRRRDRAATGRCSCAAATPTSTSSTGCTIA